MKAHLLDSLKNACRKSSATIAVIPGSLTEKLQPLDIAVSKSFKSEMRKNWKNWMANGFHTYMKRGNM